MRSYAAVIKYFFISILICTAIPAYDNETKKIMPFVSSKSACLKCHDRSEIDNPACACDEFCIKCHEDSEKHHSVGARIKDKIGLFKLTKKNKIACYTCHDLNVQRFDTVSWRSESLFEKVFRGKSRYKTYYLIMRNNNGQLCRKCH